MRSALPGSTSSRAILFGRDGSVGGHAQQPFPQYYPQPGWVEHDPNEIWESERAVAAQALRESGLGRAVAAIGIMVWGFDKVGGTDYVDCVTRAGNDQQAVLSGKMAGGGLHGLRRRREMDEAVGMIDRGALEFSAFQRILPQSCRNDFVDDPGHAATS